MLKNKWIKSIVWIIGSLAFMAIILKADGVCMRDFGLSIVPFAWIGVYFTLLLWLFARNIQKQGVKLILIYTSIVPMCLVAGELYGFYFTKQEAKSDSCNTSTSGGYALDYFTQSPITGYKGKPNTTATAHKIDTSDNSTIYNVSYQTDDFGWRITPSSDDSSNQCVLFFGDSFTIGEGVNGDETLPFYFGTEQKARIYNFGFHGYGPHQALALLLSGEVEKITQHCQSTIAFYESLPGHIKRANGFSQWERNNHAPRFALRDNKLEWINRPSDFSSDSLSQKILAKIYSNIDKSYLVKILRPSYVYDTAYNDVYFAIIDSLRQELTTRLDAPLYFILWDWHNLSSNTEKLEPKAIVTYLNASGMQYFLASQMLQNYKENRDYYALHKCDFHPNALANDKIAKHIAKEIKNDYEKSNESQKHLTQQKEQQ